MKILNIPIHHRIKHLQPIFTIAKGLKYFASGGMNGEMKLWSLDFDPVKTIKKHAGSVTSIRFSEDSKYIASSGDDGKVFVFDQHGKDVIKAIKHPCDVTHIEWTPDILISVDMDGQMILTRISDFSEFRKINSHNESILGLAVSPNFKHLCTYSENRIILYEDFNEKACLDLNKGIILENLNSRISFSPNNKFVSVGLQSNRKMPTVDIFDLNLNPVYSLVGHVAPSEITAFCPRMFKNIQKFYIVAVASQDLSLSIWNTLNPKPFVLIKNLTDSPILDMFWDDLSLYISSYDGLVKKVEFSENEFGEIVNDEDEDQDFELPFCEKNIELQRNYDKRIEKLDFGEVLDLVKLTGFTINGQSLEDAIRGDNSKSTSNGIHNELAVQDANELAVQENISIIQENGIHNELAVQENGLIIQENGIINAQDSNKQNDRQIIKDGKLSISSKIDLLKPKRIIPVMIETPKSIPVKIKKNKGTVVLFDTNLPEKLKLSKTDPFKSILNDFTVELNENVQVFRCNRLFYTINGPINKACFNEQFLVVYSKYVQVYDLKTGCLQIPYISIMLSFMDVLQSNLLLVDSYGCFTVIDLLKMKSIQGKLPKTRNLSKVELSATHFLVIEYSNEEIQFYHKKMKSWFCINPGFNSITSNGIDFLNDNDETLCELELSFTHYRLVGDMKNMRILAKQVVSLMKRMKKLDESVEYKIESILKELDKNMQRLLLEEMNKESFMHRFVSKMCRRFEIN